MTVDRLSSLSYSFHLSTVSTDLSASSSLKK